MATLRFHIVPNAKIDNVAGEHGGAIKIKLRAPAREGKANAALRTFLAEELKIPQRAIVLLSFIQSEGRRLRMRFLWLPMLGTVFVGVSPGLPLFLYLRQLELDRKAIWISNNDSR